MASENILQYKAGDVYLISYLFEEFTWEEKGFKKATYLDMWHLLTVIIIKVM